MVRGDAGQKCVAALLLLAAAASRVFAENTQCVAEYCVNQTSVIPVDLDLPPDIGMFERPTGLGAVARYPIFSSGYLSMMLFHDFFAFAMIIIIALNWLVITPRGGATHKLLGRLAIYVCMPLSIVPALAIALYVRPKYAEHPNNNFPTPFLVRIIGLYGLSYIACGLHALVFTWRHHVRLACALAGLNALLTLYSLETTRFIHSELWTGGHAPDSKVFKLCAEMSVITTAFFLWEPVNLMILVRFGIFSATGISDEFDAKRHHVLNISFLTVLALFAPMLFFFHDTYYVWTQSNGFPEHGLSWWQRTLGMVCTTLLPAFGPKVCMYYEHVKAAIEHSPRPASSELIGSDQIEMK